MHRNSVLLFEKYALPYFSSPSRVLEIGPDASPSTYRNVVAPGEISWETIDLYEHADLDYHATDEYHFPLESDTFDIVLSGQVIEHIRKPWVWIHEVTRVCKPGGYVITVIPVSWPYHEAPIDCWRAFPEGMNALYDDAGLEVELSVFESLEMPGFRRRMPGRSSEWQSRTLRTAYKMLGKIGFPVETAYDTITIGRKPL